MALMSENIITEPSSFEEVVQQPTWVDAMVEDYDSIIRNNAWEVVPRLVGKLVVGSRCIYKVKQAETSRRGEFQERWEEGVHVVIPPGVRWGNVQI